MKKEHQRKKRVVEIYFVLYLAALVLLIPGPADQKSPGMADDSFELPFAIKAEKPALFCRLMPDSLAPRIQYLDSLNSIYHTGDVDNIEYEFTVEDQLLKQKVKLSGNEFGSNKYFSIIENSERQVAYFKWAPPIKDNSSRTYIVKVTATGKLRSTGMPVSSRTQFTLVVNHITPGGPNSNIPVNPNDLAATNGTMPYGNFSPQTGEFSLTAKTDIIKTIAYETWDNEIFVLGSLNLQTDLLKNPSIKVSNYPDNNGGNAYIANYFANGFLVKGKAPAFGQTKVTVGLIRKYDRREAQLTFTIMPQAVGNPEIATVMYPGVTYTIKPHLPTDIGSDTRAHLLDDGRIRAQNPNGGEFAFTPTIHDTNKTLWFERYVNNGLYGERIRVNVKNYPAPEILRMQAQRKNFVVCQTVSRGYVSGKENYTRLEIAGNAVAFEKYGDVILDKRNNLWTQKFEIHPKDANKPFNFKVKAVDKRGVRSDEMIYNAE